MILKSKNDFDNKVVNQKDLFGDNHENETNVVKNMKDWEFEDKLSKEFEAVGFFISDHPLNQFKEIFKDYKIYTFRPGGIKVKRISDGRQLLTIVDNFKVKYYNNSQNIINVDYSEIKRSFIFPHFSDNRETQSTVSGVYYRGLKLSSFEQLVE